MPTAAPINPPPATTSGRSDLPAYLSNGVIGLRVRDIPLHAGMAIVSGLSGEHPVVRVEAAARAPYPLAGDLQLARVWLSDAPQCVRFVRQEYDFSRGELHTALIFDIEQNRAHIEVTTFCSRSHPTLVLQEVVVKVDRACDMTLRSVIDPFGCTVAGCGGTLAPRDEWGEQSPLATEYRLHARPGQSYRLRQIASMVPSQLHSQPDQEATRQAVLGQSLGYERLQEENRAGLGHVVA